MKDEIISHLNDPRQLEKLYRSNKLPFKREFNALYPELKGNTLADYWHERLNYQSEDVSWGRSNDLLFVIITALIAGLIAKLPHILSIDEEFFYTRNVGFILFPALTAYFIRTNKLSTAKMAMIGVAMLAGLVFINFFPDNRNSDTLTLSCIHLLLFLWSILGFSFVGDQKNIPEKRLGFLSYNGDLIVMTTLILIAGAILSGVTIGLFSLIGYSIEKFYFENIARFLLPAAPILGSFLTRTNPQLVGKVSPVIARIFSPLVLAMLMIYLTAMIFSGKDPYSDRDFLLIFNGLLIGVMAIIFFSIAQSSNTERKPAETWILFLLSLVTIIVNGVALSAIVFRISEWGFTPNRTAVLGGNVLILINLLLVTWQLFRVVQKKADIHAVGNSISWYLPVYFIWTTIVTFIFPLIFGFK